MHLAISHAGYGVAYSIYKARTYLEDARVAE
jgi:hypothetical protein